MIDLRHLRRAEVSIGLYCCESRFRLSQGYIWICGKLLVNILLLCLSQKKRKPRNSQSVPVTILLVPPKNSFIAISCINVVELAVSNR